MIEYAPTPCRFESFPLPGNFGVMDLGLPWPTERVVLVCGPLSSEFHRLPGLDWGGRTGYLEVTP